MAFSSNSGGGPVVDMNIIPLADVLLVLLIIFMVTAPTPSYPIDIDLPQPTNNPKPNPVNPPDPIRLRIDASGEVFWNNSPTPVSALFNMMQAEVQKDPGNQPTLELEVSGDSDYGVLAKVLGEAKAAEMQKIGFVKQEM